MGHSMEFEAWWERQEDMLREAAERRLAREARKARRSERKKATELARGFVLGIERLIHWPGKETVVHSAMPGTSKELGGSLPRREEC